MARRGDFFDNIEPLFGRGRRPDLSGFKPTRRTRRGLVIAGILLVFFLVVNPSVGFYTDLLWFRSLGFEGLFKTRIAYQAEMFAAGFVVAFVILAVNITLAVRMSSAGLTAIGVQRRTASFWGRAVAAAGALVLGLLAGGAWERLALALNATDFGASDPQFGMNVGFYVFQLPAFRFLWGWLLALLIVSTLVSGAVHLSRAATSPAPSLPLGAVVHLSLLGSAFFLLLAVHYRLAMFGLLVSQNTGTLFGLAATDAHVRLPVYWILLVFTLGLAVAMLANIYLRRGGLLVLGPAAWLIAVVVLLGIVPAAYQGLVVAPNQLTAEHDYLQRHIDATNTAFGLDAISVKDYPDSQKITPPLLAANQVTVSNLRLWDYGPLQTAYQQIESIRLFYSFHDVDIDRYQLKDGYRQVMISARELDLDPAKVGDQAQNWVNLHLKYTHGYGAAATPVTQVGAEGLPVRVLGDIPPQGELALTRPQVYFGETTTGWVVAASKEAEIDGKGDVSSRWEGTDGVSMSGLTRLLYAYSLGDLNLLISAQVSDGSQLLYRRDITTRLQTLAPFLSYDHDPYIVDSGGKLFWIADAYTTSSAYPYSQPITVPHLEAAGDVNYIRNSVKAVMDAYDGSVKFYISDPKDPIIQAYAKIFPGVLHPISEMPADLRAHVRYPEDLFGAQAATLQKFHVHDPGVFFQTTDAWTQPLEVLKQGASPVPLQPYYVVMRLPGQDREEFVMIQPFTPVNKKNMVAWLAVQSDGADYGKLVAFKFPSGRAVPGPEQVESNIDQDTTIGPQLTLLNKEGSRVIRGNLLVIPMGDAILYVEPIYTESTSGAAIPELKKVVVADEQRVVWADTLGQALELLTGGQVTTPQPNPSGTPSTVADLTARLDALFNDAQARLKAGDLGGYQADIDEMGKVIQQLKAVQGASPNPSPGASPRATPKPSPSR